MNKLGQCQECHKNEAKYAMFRTKDGRKEWVYVCKECERLIGRENIKRAGGWYKEEI